MARRLAGHVGNYKKYLNGIYHYVSSFKVLENDEFDAVLIEKFPCDSKDELFAGERYWTKQINCVNKIKNQGLLIELGQVEYSKQQGKKYREANKDKIYAKDKIYREQNIDKKKEYYENNKVKITEYKNENHECQCGSTFTINNRGQHLRSKKHQNWSLE